MATSGLGGFDFAAYALQQASRAVLWVTGEDKGAGPRLKAAGIAVSYAGPAVLTFEVIAGRSGSQAHRGQALTARIMAHAGARWLIGWPARPS